MLALKMPPRADAQGMGTPHDAILFATPRAEANREPRGPAAGTPLAPARHLEQYLSRPAPAVLTDDAPVAPRMQSDAVVSVAAARSLLAAMGPFHARGNDILRDSGIVQVEGEEWVSLHGFRRALRTIGETMGPNTLFQIGRQVAHHLPIPGGVDTFEKVLAAISIAYDLMHRGMVPGSASFTVENARTAVVTTRSPYPCDFERGVIAGFFQLLLHVRPGVEVVEREPCPLRCGEAYTYTVTLPDD